MSTAKIEVSAEKEIRELQIPIYVETLQDKIERLYETYHLLRDRLMPVVNPAHLDTVREDQERVGKTPHAVELEEFIDRLENLNDNLHMLIQALEI